ncbi:MULTISPECIES: DMT family transporter [unclassified Lentimicrobium]|uniref:DMT family transporter n=1 Tax=unclassified Lentimicrobium TaxID=2677434 RepID=UPI001554D2D7|nr:MULTISPECIES: DMT family transporter [unclassified Lentimicrobium]NPD47335.1 EamA family transporter [Lentimicrobium sp. S6]NPD85340.1 EamA family transporter [Lentimicrobium sp. L6]
MESKANKQVILGAVVIGISATFWGFDGIVLTPRLFNLPVPFVVFILHLVPFLLMNFFLYKRYSLLSTLTRTELFSLIMVATFGGSIGTMAIVKALFLVNFQSLSIVVLLQKLQPVFAISLAALFLKEKLRRNFLLWAIIALIAGYFLTFGASLPHIQEDKNTIYASLLAVLAAFSFGSSTVFSKKVLGKLDFISATFFRYGFTATIMFVVVTSMGFLGEFNHVTPQNWMVIFIIAMTTGSGAIFLYYFGLKKVKAIIATIMELFFPMSAILFDYFINGHLLSSVQWVSAAVMIFAIINLNADNSKALKRFRKS